MFLITPLLQCRFLCAEVGDSLNGTVGHVKDAVVGAVHGIGQGLDGVLHTATDGAKTISTTLISGVGDVANGGTTTDSGTEYTHIPLKDPGVAMADGDQLAEFKQSLQTRADSMEETLESGVDELMMETADLGGGASDGGALESMSVSQTTTVDAAVASAVATADGGGDGGGEGGGVVDDNNDVVGVADNGAHVANKTPTHSIDSLRTSSPDPEIERALSNKVDGQRKVSSPEPTINELGELQRAADTMLKTGGSVEQ